MTDIIDKTNDDMELVIESQVNFARKNTQKRLKPKGRCYYCETELFDNKAVFCDADCSSDYEYIKSRRNSR